MCRISFAASAYAAMIVPGPSPTFTLYSIHRLFLSNLLCVCLIIIHESATGLTTIFLFPSSACGSSTTPKIKRQKKRKKRWFTRRVGRFPASPPPVRTPPSIPPGPSRAPSAPPRRPRAFEKPLPRPTFKRSNKQQREITRQKHGTIKKCVT